MISFKKKLIGNKDVEIDGPVLISPELFKDKRGFFMESWNHSKFSEIVENAPDFVQDNHSKSIFGVLRGLHYQSPPNPQGKLIMCIKGEIFDVAVDLRRSSKTYGHWVSIHLKDEKFNQFWIPEGFAHGFLTLSKSAEVIYKTTNYWHPDDEHSIRWDDPTLNISWPKLNIDPILSKRDLEAYYFNQLNSSQLFR